MSNELSRLVAKYVDNDNPQDALDAVAGINFELMRKYEEGVPSGVMFAATTTANERIAMMLAGMIIDVAKEVHGWSDSEAAEQEGLTRAMITLLAADSMRDTLVALQPGGSDEG